MIAQRRAHELLVDRRHRAIGRHRTEVVRCASWRVMRLGVHRAVRRKAEPACERPASRRWPARTRRCSSLGREAAQHRDDAVVARDAMKAQRKRHEPEARGGEPAAPQIAHDHRAPRDAIHLARDSRSASASSK